MIRFHMIGLHRSLFADRVLAEMMAPISPEGDSLFWDYLGRRFVSLSYDEADRFCQYSREFITSLLPKDPIYLSLLPPNARAAVAQVHSETKSARAMLERLGFEYRNFVDPFDGGPHLDVKTDEIPPVAHTHTRTVANAVAATKCTEMCIVSKLDPDGEFMAIHEKVSLVDGNAISLTKECMQALEVEKGDEVGVTPMNFFAKPDAAAASTIKKTSRKKTSKSGSKR